MTESHSNISRSASPTMFSAVRDHTTVSTSDFQRIRLIGRGELGRVYLVRHIPTQQLYAMKVLPKEEMIRKDKIKRVHTERELLQTAKHPFVVTLYWSFQNPVCLYLVMDFCQGGEFFRALQRQPRRCLQEDGARFYAAEVLLGLEYLHMLGFIYRDLKPENILLTASGHIVLTDFDLCKHAAKETTPQILKSMFSDSRVRTEPGIVTNSFVGTEEYIAPEVIVGHGHTSSVDWWTFGILLYEMLYGFPPFRGKDKEDTFSQILLCTLKFPPHKFPISKQAKDIIKQLLRIEPNKRLGAENGACDVKQHRFFAGLKWSMIRNQTPPIVPHLTDEEDTSYFPFLEDDGTIAQLEANAATASSPMPASAATRSRSHRDEELDDEDKEEARESERSPTKSHHSQHKSAHAQLPREKDKAESEGKCEESATKQKELERSKEQKHHHHSSGDREHHHSRSGKNHVRRMSDSQASTTGSRHSTRTGSEGDDISGSELSKHEERGHEVKAGAAILHGKAAFIAAASASAVLLREAPDGAATVRCSHVRNFTPSCPPAQSQQSPDDDEVVSSCSASSQPPAEGVDAEHMTGAVEFDLVNFKIAPSSFEAAGGPPTPADVLVHPLVRVCAAASAAEAGPGATSAGKLELLVVWRRSAELEITPVEITQDTARFALVTRPASTEVERELASELHLQAPAPTQERRLDVVVRYPSCLVRLADIETVHTTSFSGLRATLC
eukprot:TRINITY_DN1035_c0_g1_i1.p1 TRINITY_DN1035_c0_g1~~TRINITY_DN1035_c0_g1_i1.p1  ORF type:complete len:728 (-),score=166.31 TRINITY_DN1035_c0_g1_i1:79-2262(-)